MYRIAETYEEKRAAMMYWENVRKIAAKIRDEYDKPTEDAFNRQFMKRSIKSPQRPDFMEPYKKISLFIKINYK